MFQKVSSPVSIHDTVTAIAETPHDEVIGHRRRAPKRLERNEHLTSLFRTLVSSGARDVRLPAQTLGIDSATAEFYQIFLFFQSVAAGIGYHKNPI